MKKFDYRILFFLGLLGILLREYSPWFKLFYLFFFIVLLPKPRQVSDNEPNGAYYRSKKLAGLNPITFFQSIGQLLGHVIIKARYSNGLPDAGTYQNTQPYSLPFTGKWYVVNGGVEEETSHSWQILTQRYAYDFVVMDIRGKTYTGRGKNLTDYYCFNQSILSIGSGKVVHVNNSVNDYEGVGDESIDWKVKNFLGNNIIIQHSENEFSFYGHLKKDSLRVKKNQVVTRSQVIAACGNSGHSTEPHLHFHLMDKKNFYVAMGLPVLFHDFIVYDKKQQRDIALSSGYPEKDFIVQSVPVNEK